MQIHSINSYNPNSRALDYRKVIGNDRSFVMDELKQLEELGKKYDITLKSDVAIIIAPYKCIKVTVSPLRENLSFLRKIFRPKVSLNFYTTEQTPYPEADNEYLTDIVKYAINALK